QREERTFVGTARHQIITGTFGGGAGQDRGFKIPETVGFQVTTHMGRYLGTEAQLFLHFRTTQVHKAVFQTHVFAHIGVPIQRERRRGGLVQNTDFFTQHFDHASFHIGVSGAGRTATHTTGNLYHVFRTHAVGGGERFRGIRIEHYLHHALTVTHIQEDHTTVIAATVHPARESYGLVDQGFVDITTVMCAHRLVLHLNRQ